MIGTQVCIVDCMTLTHYYRQKASVRSSFAIVGFPHYDLPHAQVMELVDMLDLGSSVLAA